MKKTVIACLGDSITFGHGVADTREKDAWTFVLQRMLGGGYEVYNYGRNGATAIEDVPDSYMDTGLPDKAVRKHEDICILMLGTNDTKSRYWNAEAYRKGLMSIAGRILKEGSGRLILMLPPCIFPSDDGTTAYDVSAYILAEEVIPIIRETAQHLGADVIDLYSITKDHPEYYLEGVHPNIQGNRAIAEEIFRHLK